MASGHASRGSSTFTYLQCCLLFLTAVFLQFENNNLTVRNPSLCANLKVWNLQLNPKDLRQITLPTICYRHVGIRYSNKYFKRRVSYSVGNLASYNTSVVTLKFFIAWDVNLNPGPSTVTSDGQSKSFSSALVNARSLKSIHKRCPTSSEVISNLNAFQAFVYREDLDIVCVTETWLNDTVFDSELLPYNYSIFRKDRNDHRIGGGVLISLKSTSFKDISVISNECDNLELMSLLCTTHLDQKFVLCCCYRPPDSDIAWFDHFADVLNIVGSLGYRVVIVGDFNLPQVYNHDSLETSTSNNHRFSDLLNDNFLHQINNYPTRNNNILDLLITNTPELLSITDVLSPNQMGIYTDHNGLLFNVQMVLKAPPKFLRYVYDFPKGDLPGLKVSLANACLLSCISDDNENLDNDWSFWKESFLSHVDQFVPKRKLKDRNSPPWINANIRHLLNQKDTIRRKLRSNSSPLLKQSYRDLRAQIKQLIQESRSAYFDKVGFEIHTNPKRFWSLIKTFTKSSNRTIPSSVSFHANNPDTPTVTADKPQVIADLFNTYFQSVQKLPSADNCFEDNRDVITTSDLPSFEVTNAEVKHYLNTIDVNKATGPDGISGRLLKECADEICDSLTKLFNKSLRTGVVPTEWKLANIIPLYKHGVKSHIENYRPISLLSLVSKLLERCILKQLLSKVTHLIHNNQHGFLPRKSCTTHLLTTFNDIGMRLDTGEEIDILYTDMSKAFDRVNHNLLLAKLKHAGLPSPFLKWMSSYISNRQQQVIVLGATSQPLTVVSGVPQGSILGPILFLIYSNDILSSCDKGAMYADDLKCYKSITSYDDAKSFQFEINSVSRATQNCQLDFNESKCSVLRISRKINRVEHSYQINELVLTSVNKIKDLGVHVTSNLDWSEHVYNTSKKANKMLGLLRRCTIAFQRPETRRILYLTLVRSHFSYASQLWAPQKVNPIQEMEKIQRRATKFILNLNYLSVMPYQERLLSLDILPVSYWLELHDLLFLFKVVNGLVSLPLGVCPAFYVGARRTRSSTSRGRQLVVRKCRTTTDQNSYFVRMAKLWNILPCELTLEDQTLSGFKRKLNSYYKDALRTVYDIDDCRTWKSICIKCKSARLLHEKPHCCF